MKDKKILTSISVSVGTKLYEYLFYSEIQENTTNDRKISPSIQNLLAKALTSIGKHLKKNIENIVIYRDAVNEKQMDSLESEIREKFLNLVNTVKDINQKQMEIINKESEIALYNKSNGKNIKKIFNNLALKFENISLSK